MMLTKVVQVLKLSNLSLTYVIMINTTLSAVYLTPKLGLMTTAMPM